MPLELGVWRIDGKPARVDATRLESESRLEDLIADDVSLVRADLWIIGRQVSTTFGHFVDLLAINATGNLTMLELKRDKTPREVVAQALDYGCWMKRLGRAEVERIYEEYIRKYHPDRAAKAFDAAFAERFGVQPPEVINEAQELLVVAAELDASTERIIAYLGEYGVPLNALFFRVFKDSDREYLTRAWLRDPDEAEQKAEEAQAQQSRKEPWNQRDFYFSFGGESRDWEDARKYGFVSAGGGLWYTRTLRQLQPGHRVFVHVPEHGYVGVGTVTRPATRADRFIVSGKNVRSTP